MIDALALAERLRALEGLDRAGQLAGLGDLTVPELEAADDLMADGWRERAGHAESSPPLSGWTDCDRCGRLRGLASILVPVYHPAEVSCYLP